MLNKDVERIAIEKMNNDCFTDDPEMNHMRADNIIITSLQILGLERLADRFMEVERWYS